MKPEFMKTLKRRQISLIEEEDEEIKQILKVQNKRETQQKKYFQEWTEKSKDFIVSNFLVRILLYFFMKFHVRFL